MCFLSLSLPAPGCGFNHNHVAGADSLIMESSRRVTGAGKRKGLNPVKQVLLQPHESNSAHHLAETSRLAANPDGEKEVKRSREAVASAPLDLSVSKAEVGGRCRKQVRKNLLFFTRLKSDHTLGFGF